VTATVAAVLSWQLLVAARGSRGSRDSRDSRDWPWLDRNPSTVAVGSAVAPKAEWAPKAAVQAPRAGAPAP